MERVFFYGLFMDKELLKSKGLHPANKKIVYAEGFGLRIGEKATLIKSSSEKAYGVVMDLSEEELESLYSAPGVSEYVPETLKVTDLDRTTFPALCYNLPASKVTGSNTEYAQSLALLSRNLGFPDVYIEHILSYV